MALADAADKENRMASPASALPPLTTPKKPKDTRGRLISTEPTKKSSLSRHLRFLLQRQGCRPAYSGRLIFAIVLLSSIMAWRNRSLELRRGSVAYVISTWSRWVPRSGLRRPAYCSICEPPSRIRLSAFARTFLIFSPLRALKGAVPKLQRHFPSGPISDAMPLAWKVSFQIWTSQTILTCQNHSNQLFS